MSIARNESFPPVITTERRHTRSICRAFTVATIAATAHIALVLPTLTLGDDTDIYSPPLDPTFQPTLMFMVDTSGSMKIEDHGWTAGWRRDRLLGPLVDFIGTAKDVRAGLSSFNGSRRGGAVLHAAQDLDHDLCPDAGCGEITVRTPIMRDSDDGYEDLRTGRTALLSSVTEAGELLNDIRTVVRDSRPLDGSTVIETDGGVMMASDELTLFRNEAGKVTRIGFHFPNFPVPRDVDVFFARLEMPWFGNAYLDPDAGEGSGTARARITFDSRASSPPFADANGQRVSDRPRAPGHIDWNIRRPSNWRTADSDSRPMLHSPNLASLFNAVRSPSSNGTVTLMLEPAPGMVVDKENMVALLGAHDRGADYRQPRFYIRGHDPHKPTPAYQSAFRFDGLNVPKGARITGAHMVALNYNAARGGPMNLRIRTEATGHARPFEHGGNGTHDFSKRTTFTGDSVQWQTSRRWLHYERVQTPDIAALVQQVVSHPDWCAGNALALHLDGEGEARFFAHERSPHEAPALYVTYDPASVDAADTCRIEGGQDTLLLASEGDVVQREGRALQEGLATWDTGAGVPRLGLRFSDVNLAADDEIASARLDLSTVDLDVSARTRLVVRIDSDTAAMPFDGPLSLADREAGEPHVRWYTDQIANGAQIRSIDLAPLVRRALADPSWERGSDLVFTVRRAGNHPVKYATSHSTEAGGPTLRIARKLRGQAAVDLPLLTSRDVLIERLQTLPALGETPLLDAFYETSQYMLGGEVVHGRRRGEQADHNRSHRLSDPASYTGGLVYRPMGCAADDPEDPACAGETIEGNATYVAPPGSECRPNQIVLVTDGDPSQMATSTPERIRTLTGEASCESGSASEACATELASWLAAGGEDRAPVRVNTVGFAVDSPFLDQVANAGGGRAFTVSTGAALTKALVAIGQSATHESATLTGPAISVSQFNRSSHRDDVYLGLFQPDDTGTLWPGNLKRYAFGPLPDDGFGLIDTNGQPVVDPDTGRFASSARSWWSATADGAAVTEGGAASRLPTNRRLLTWPAASTGAAHGLRTLVDFEEANTDIRAADLGVDEAVRSDTIRWMRGFDALDEDQDGVVDEARRSMGAAIHTTPAIIDYASSSPDGRSVVFAGTQEGFLHAVDTDNGRELFGFLPFELYADAAAFMESLPGPMRYGLDGPVTSWTSDENGNGVVDAGETAYVTVGMRRGGKHYYTLDVSDPDAPSLAWTIDPSRAGFEQLRQSWSAMTPLNLRADPDASPDGTSVRRALVFTSGYDPKNDDRTPDRTRTRRRSNGGAAIYLVDPHTGDLLHGIAHPQMSYAIPSDVAVVDVELDGLDDLLLVGDLAGRLWQVELTATGSGGEVEPVPDIAWNLSLNSTRTSRNGAETDRRFFHAPDVALMSRGSEPPTLAVAIGSGRRDHPLELTTRDRLYMLSVDPGNFRRNLRHHRLYDVTDTPSEPGPGYLGWYIDLERPGEKVLGTPIIVDGRVLVTSYVPGDGTGDPCDPDLGTGHLHALDAFTAAPALADPSSGGNPVRSVELAAPGIPPPVTVMLDPQGKGGLSVFAGLEQIDAVDPIVLRQQTYWITD